MEQIANYLMFHHEKVEYPDRTAIFIRTHPYMTQLDFFDMQEAQEIQWEEQQQQHLALEAARQMGQGVAEAEARQHRRRQDRNAGYYGAGLNWDGGGGGYGGGRYGGDGGDGGGGGGKGGGRGMIRGREDVGDNFYERMRQEAADARQTREPYKKRHGDN